MFFQVNTPTPVPMTEADDILGQVSDMSATAQAMESSQPITTDGSQIYDSNGVPLLPNSNSTAMINTVSYAKFVLDASSAQAIFGPFSPIITHIKIFFTLSLVWFSGYFVMRLYTLALRFIGWLMENWQVAIIIFVITLFIAFMAWLEIRFNFFTNSIDWIMQKIQSIFTWMKGVF